MSAYGVKRRIVSAAPGAAADVEIVPAVSGKRIIVQAFWIVASATGTHARFRSGTNEIFGGGSATQGIPLGANGGVVINNAGEDPSDFWFSTNQGEALNLRVEAAGEITVGVIYEER